MPLRSPPIARLALTALASASLLMGVAGCSTVSQWWPWGEESRQFEPVSQETALTPIDLEARAGSAVPPAEAAPVAPAVAPIAAPLRPGSLDEVLSYWETIDGGLVGPAGGLGKALDVLSGGEYVRLSRPTALAVQGDYLYVVDSGLELVLRINRVSQRVDRLVELSGIVIGEVGDIFVASDFSFLLADTYGSRVLRFDARGRLQQIFQNKLNLSRPVAVAIDDQTGDVLVADGEFDHILVFTPAGELVTAMGGRGNEPGQFLNITSMARGAGAFIVGARVGQRIQAINRRGDYLYSFPQDAVVFPMAMAADEEFRVFIGDYLDNTIKVFERGRFIASIGGTGVESGRFKRVTDLWVDKEFLYVADSLNSRVQVLRISSAAPSPFEEQR